MRNRFLPGLIAIAFCFIIALPAHAQDPPTTQEKGRAPRAVVKSPAQAQASITPEKKALIKEFMKLMTTSTNSEAVVDQFLGQGLKQSAPLISKALLTDIPQDKLSPDEEKRLKSEADEAK